ncbi:MAG: amidohydrolase family protein [Myxococcota bacterium]
MSALRVDAHQHFWRYDAAELPWIDDAMALLRRDFLADDLAALLRVNGIDACVAVQARDSRAETEFLLAQAERHAIVSAVVGWTDLRAPGIDAELERLREHRKLAGFRHVAQAEADDFLSSPEVVRGVGALGRFGFSFDLLVFARQLPAAIALARALPQQRFVLDHIGKPEIRARKLEPWASQVRELARLPNVCCKLSGLVTEAYWTRWEAADFRPYVDVILEAFGPRRLLFGSDWPVCLVAATYARGLALVNELIGALSDQERDAILGGNAVEFYGIGVPPEALER